MANEDHLKILKKGVNHWNKWRKKNPKLIPNLRNAFLSDRRLQYIDFQRTDLYRADLSGVNLCDSNLHRADLSNTNLNSTDLSNANLSKADLSDANVQYADLSNANLSSASLSYAHLNATNLYETNLKEASFGGTVLANLNLSTTKYLEECQHVGPSIMNSGSLKLSGNLPLVFLRGIGLSDWEIEAAKMYNPKLTNPHIISEILYQIHIKRADTALQFDSVFISYQTNDRDTFVNKLYNDLQNSGVRCWYAPHDLKGGKKIHKQIEDGIHLRDRTLLVLSEASLKSSWFEHEVRTARKREREEDRQVLYPISLIPYEELKTWKLFDADEGRDLAAEIREYYIPDFSKEANYTQEFAELLRSLRKTSFGLMDEEVVLE